MPSLFDPLRVGDLTLPNRVIMAPLTRLRAAPGRSPKTCAAAQADIGIMAAHPAASARHDAAQQQVAPSATWRAS